MKNLFLLIIVVLLFSCKSNQSSLKNYSADFAQRGSVVVSTTDSTAVKSETNKTAESKTHDTTQEKEDKTTVAEESRQSATQVNTSEYSRNITFAPGGAVSGIQESWRSTGSNQSSTSTGRLAENTVNNKQGESTANQTSEESTHTTLNNIEKSELVIDTSLAMEHNYGEESNSKSDSRWIQGIEWLYVIAVLVVALAVGIYRIRKEK